MPIDSVGQNYPPCGQASYWYSIVCVSVIFHLGAGRSIMFSACYGFPVDLDTCWVEDRVEILIISSASGRSAICAPAGRRA